MPYPTHRYWTGPRQSWASFTGHSARSASPGVLIEWTDDTLPVECHEEVADGQGKVHPHDAIKHATNIVRWWLLAKYGGFWIHHDVIAFTPFDQLPFPVTALHENGIRCTCFMAFPKEHPTPLAMLDHIRRAPLSDLHSAQVSGENVLTELADASTGALMLPLANSGRRIKGTEPWAVLLRARGTDAT